MLLRGNHDYWWSSVSRLNGLYAKYGMYFLQNDCFMLPDGKTAICGARLWKSESTEAEDIKIYRREIIRAKLSLDAAMRKKCEKIIFMSHYPPLLFGETCSEICELFKNYPQGYTEFTDGEDLHTYTKIIDGKRYVLTRHQGNFEIWERHLFRIGVVGFLLLIAICSFVGWYLGRKLLSPLGQLTKEAVRAEGLIQNGKIYTEEIFKGYWPDNEIGELERSFKALVSKLKVLAMKERAFSTEVSHEVRTPLTVIDTSLELLNEQVQSNDRQKTLIRRAQNASSRIKGMAEVFLNIGRARTGQNNALCSMPELIAGLKESWKQKAENKGLKLSVELKNAPKQTFNEVLGATIFDNLVFNSIHYTDKGSVTVIIDEDKAIIRDTGIGIKEEDREKVFDRGFRAGQGSRGHYQGFGLGLAISKRAAEALGWSISLKSEVGKGTDFEIRFKSDSVNEVNGD